MSESIQRLRVYTTAREIEDKVYELIKTFDSEHAYPFGNDLRRSSAAVCHYLTEAHHCFSYGLKLENLTEARIAAENAQALLAQPWCANDTKQLRDDYTSVIKQIWGFIRYLKSKRQERATRVEIAAKDELVAARA